MMTTQVRELVDFTNLIEKQKILIICGPTASGKSSFAFNFAKNFQSNAIIINSDSMQLYHDLPIITAQPSSCEQMEVQHKLYGILNAQEKCDVASWCELAAEEIKNAFHEKKLPIIVGGTGMYIKSLIEGLSEIPKISSETKNFFAEKTKQEIVKFLESRNDLILQQISQNDYQRLKRAAEVLYETGKSLISWQNSRKSFFDQSNFELICVWPNREKLKSRIDLRFDHMLSRDVENELSKFYAKRDLIPSFSPALKAHGVPEFFAYFQGEHSLQHAIERAKIVTKQYAKRQFTWYRHQLKNIRFFEFDNFEEVNLNCNFTKFVLK